MEDLFKSELPGLAKDLEYKVEPILASDKVPAGTFLKLVIHKTSIYLFPSGRYISYGHLSQEEVSVLDGWIEVCKSKKLNSAAPILSVTYQW